MKRVRERLNTGLDSTYHVLTISTFLVSQNQIKIRPNKRYQING
jgi:hypothetical protein